jgi:hypothetical protein
MLLTDDGYLLALSSRLPYLRLGYVCAVQAYREASLYI